MLEYDIEELAKYICGLSDDDETEVDDCLYDKFEIDFDGFQRIVKSLLPLCAMGKSPLSGIAYQGFAKGNCFLVKQEIKED